jgi:multiple sugar transport system substrate-binding protein
MVKMRRVLKGLALVAAALAASTMVAACGGGNASAAAKATTLKVWVMGDDGSNFKTVVKDFTASTNITVDVQAIPWDQVTAKLTTAVASGNGPDVMQVGLSQLGDFQKAGALADLSSSIGGYPNLASGNFLDAVSTDKLNPAGKVLSVPWISDTRVLFYRTDILAAQGIATPPTTWTQLKDDATKLATRGKDKYGYYIPQWDAPLPVEFTWQAGGDVVDSSGKVNLDTPEFQQAVDFYLSFYTDKVVPTASDFDQTQGFISGSAPMLISGPYLAKSIGDQAPQLSGKWGVSVLPSDKTGTSLFAGSDLGVFSKSTKVDAALKLLNFMSEPATQLKWYQLNGDLPTVKAALNDPSMASDPNVKVYVQQLSDSKLLPITSTFDPISQKMLDALNQIALKGANEQATLAKLNQDVAGLQK